MRKLLLGLILLASTQIFAVDTKISDVKGKSVIDTIQKVIVPVTPAVINEVKEIVAPEIRDSLKNDEAFAQEVTAQTTEKETKWGHYIGIAILILLSAAGYLGKFSKILQTSNIEFIQRLAGDFHPFFKKIYQYCLVLIAALGIVLALKLFPGYSTLLQDLIYALTVFSGACLLPLPNKAVEENAKPVVEAPAVEVDK